MNVEQANKNIKNESNSSYSFSVVLITLMKGITYRDNDNNLWQSLINMQSRVREHIALMGLELIIDDAEGYAYLRQHSPVDGEAELPRLVPRRPLPYAVSLLLVLLRQKLIESDAQGADSRLILNREQIIDLMRVFLADSGNEARLVDRIDTLINKVIDLGFIRRLRSNENEIEVKRILKAFVDAQWLNEFEQRLAEYREHSTLNI
ncbi:MAG: DUF4194 domain-containing protein [Deltaproteobacteria bacterium]|nr:DUF4194 domain-containing protein [Deltaproteobacteria bacterium]